MDTAVTLEAAKTPRRDAVIAALRALAPELKARGVEHVYLFGSVARDEAKPGSDVDLFFDYRADRPPSMLKVIAAKHLLEDHFGLSFDLVSRRALHPLLKQRIEASGVPVF